MVEFFDQFSLVSLYNLYINIVYRYIEYNVRIKKSIKIDSLMRKYKLLICEVENELLELIGQCYIKK